MSKDKQVFQHTLANGLHIIGEANPNNKSCGIGFFVNTGARDETPVEAGVSHFLEHMMFKGTPKRSAIQLTYDMGNIGAQANAYTSQENTVYYAGIIPEYLSAMQEILSDMLRPSLDVNEFNTEKNVILEEIALYMDMPHSYLYELANKEFFGTHPLSNSVLGTTQSITDLKRDQMKDYFDRRYSPANMVLVVSGDLKWDIFKSQAEELCSGWQNFKTGRNTPKFNMQACERIYHKSNLQQAHLLLSAPGASTAEDERFSLAVLASILGDSTGSKFYWELVDTGLVESANCDHDEHDGAGSFSAYVTMEPDRLDQVTEIVQKILKDVRNFTEDELERAKTKLLTRIVMNGELPMGRLMALGTTWLYRKEIHSLQAVLDKVRGVSRATIEKSLDRYPLNNWCKFVLLPE